MAATEGVGGRPGQIETPLQGKFARGLNGVPSEDPRALFENITRSSVSYPLDHEG